MHYYSNLNENERQQIVDAIPLITLYIANADGNIDTKETAWSEKVVKFRMYDGPAELNEYYKQVGLHYEERLNFFTAFLLKNGKDALVSELEKLNSILAKMNPVMAFELYTSFLSFAKHVAESDGGFLGYFATGPKEEEMIGLPMLNPIK
ncbi:MAG: hypothetical protein R2798_10240 [Chitinophagales bacterium]|nr:hypothetical protein [Bacteroidota bacterium]MCB9044057.1 hypothetical protein [Chitinophagales bacterium]